MINETIDLYKYYGRDRNGTNGGYLTVYARTESKEVKKRIRPAVLVIPGGAYTGVSDREGEPVALKYLDASFVSFVLSYSVKTKYPVPLNEAMLTMKYIRDNAEKYNIDKDRVCAIGFSAGGHLCGLLATTTDEEAARINVQAKDIKPNAVVLSYPVVTMGEYGHGDSRFNITGGDTSLYEKLSVEKRVNNNSAPAFIWHTYEDTCVPMENSLLLTSAYRKCGVPISLHIFEHGGHGLSLANDEVCDDGIYGLYAENANKWFELSLDWLKARNICMEKVR